MPLPDTSLIRSPSYRRRMAGDDDRLIDLDVRAVGSGERPGDPGLDAIEMGSPGTPWRRWRRLRVAGLVCVALIVGAALGYYIGTLGAEPKTGPTEPSGAAPTARLLVPGGGQPPTATGNRCSVQLGSALQLGLEIVNQSAAGTTLLGAQVGLPLNGLRLTAIAWGSCGQLSVIDGASPYPLPPGATTWLRMTFDVLTPCPAPLPVQINLRYAQAQTVAVAFVGGFSDLGDVAYSGCSASPG
jgi:hypothetical protein